MYITALLTIAKKHKNLVSINRKMDKQNSAYRRIHTYIHTEEYSLTINVNEVLIHRS